MSGISERNESNKRAFNAVLNDINAQLGFLLELGCTGVDCSDKTLKIIKNWGRSGTKNLHVLPDIFNDFVKCRQCSFAGNRKNMVCGDGDPEARLFIVGGIPEPEDVQTGKPYSGAAGELLNKIISAMNLARKEIYITHAVKCCLPVDKKPNIRDVNFCRYYLSQEIKLIKPDIICAFGKIATMSLLETSVPLSRLRGRFHDYKGLRVMPTYSPEYLIENPDAKRMVWEDIKLVMGELNKSNNDILYGAPNSLREG